MKPLKIGMPIPKVHQALCIILILSSCVLSSCTATRCPYLIDYQSKKVDIKALGIKLGKSDVGIGEVHIDTLNRDASETVKKLDIVQHDLCQTLHSMPPGENKTKAQSNHVDTLTDMYQFLIKNTDIIQEKKTNLPQTTEELESLLKEQIDFLHRSARYFDSGITSEAKRLASSLRIILEGGAESSSLLSQLRIHDNLRFVNTAIDYSLSSGSGPYHGLVRITLSTDTGGSYRPPLGEERGIPPTHPILPFEEWWNAIIIDDKKGHKLTRKLLVMHISNQDGGSDIQPAIDPDYVAIAKQNSLGWVTRGSKDSEDRPIHGVELASIRQITYEVLESIKTKYPQYFQNQQDKP